MRCQPTAYLGTSLEAYCSLKVITMVTRMPSDELRRRDDIMVAVHCHSSCVVQHSTKSQHKIVTCPQSSCNPHVNILRRLDVERGVVNRQYDIGLPYCSCTFLIAINETAVAIQKCDHKVRGSKISNMIPRGNCLC